MKYWPKNVQILQSGFVKSQNWVTSYYLTTSIFQELFVDKFDSNLEGRSSRKFFCWVFSQKNLTDLRTNFTKFEVSTIFLTRDMPD